MHDVDPNNTNWKSKMFPEMEENDVGRLKVKIHTHTHTHANNTHNIICINNG